jgi:AcrR family transcriptional regulator
VSPQPAAAARGRGRPRSPEAHRAILTATLELLGELGFRGLTIEGVADRAGVGKTTIYRRWPSKTELVAEAIGQVRPPSAPPDSGSLQADLGGLMRSQQERVGSTPGLRRLIPVLLTEATQDPAFLTLVTEGVIEPIREVLRELIQRAIDRGELRPDVDTEALVDLLHAVPVYRILLAGGDTSKVGDVPSRVVPLLLAGAGRAASG